MQQMQHSQQMQLVQQMQQMQQMQQVTRSNNILHTTLLTIPEEKSPVDITNDDQDTIIEEIEVIV
ncbi:hypothetical protein RirG_149380 [Rhizophagus irregularis DAOM 197198w]|nr:hypothetical protein RirG_149380 [Rhizophagus irregularis DAOM 197198w]